MTRDEQLFAAVADALIAADADDRTKHDVLATVMDRHGVPMLMLKVYSFDPAIVGLFAERGVRFATAEEREAGRG